MIEQIKFIDFKSFAFQKPITLPRFLVLVGDNAAGKSNFCDAFDFARDLLENGLREALLDDEYRGGFHHVVRGRRDSRVIACQFVFAGTDWRLEYEFKVGLSARRGEPEILSESLMGYLDGQHETSTGYLKRETANSHAFDAVSGKPERWGVEPDYLQLARLVDEERFPALRRVRDLLRSVLVLRPNPHTLRQPATVGGELRLGSSGESLPAILDAADVSQLKRLADWLAEGDRTTRLIKMLSTEPGKKVIGVLERDQQEPYRPQQISDGTLRLLAMLAAITGVAPNISTLVIEEPENGVHFSRLNSLVKLCRERVEQDPSAQIILTTHSIPLLHALRREEVMAIVRRDDGASQILPPPAEDKWRKFQEEASYTIGDLYTTGLWPEQQPRLYEP
jgi:predicted ATPase